MYEKPTVNRKIVRSVLKMLRKVEENSEYNRMTTSNLAVIFQPTFFPHRIPDYRKSDSQGTVFSMGSVRSGQSWKSSQASRGFSGMVESDDGASGRDTLVSGTKGSTSNSLKADKFQDFIIYLILHSVLKLKKTVK